MTTTVEIVNRALQSFGSRTTVTAVELAGNTTNEAIQANLVLNASRDELLRMAPWDCGMKVANLTYITSLPGTPENTSPATSVWQRGQPMPPWVYEYQYPVDCLKGCWIIPQMQTSISGVPIFPVVTGWAPTVNGPPPRWKVATDIFYGVTEAAVSSGGTGYAVGDIITLASGDAGAVPIGAPAQLVVTAAPGGVVSAVDVVNQILGASPAVGGSYFSIQGNPVAQGSTTGGGSGALFNLTFAQRSPQRVVLCNESQALFVYIQQVTDPNVMDPSFIEAWIHALGSKLCLALTEDKKKANFLVEVVNQKINQARIADANEGLTVNDFTPDWIRARGYLDPGVVSAWGPFFDWGGLWPSYA